MFRFAREKILPLFLEQKMTVAELARKAGIANASAQRAVEGKKVAAPIIAKVADALGIAPMDYLDEGKTMLRKKTITIEKDDGTKKAVELSVDDSEEFFTVWSSDDDDIQKAIAGYLAEKKKAG